MRKIEQNGPGFRYQVKFKRHNDPAAIWETVNINDARNNTYVVWGTNTYEAFDIQLKSFNVKGSAPVQAKTIIGYSGEDSEFILLSDFIVILLNIYYYLHYTADILLHLLCRKTDCYDILKSVEENICYYEVFKTT